MSLSNPSTAAKAAFTIFGNSDNSQTIQGKNELQLQWFVSFAGYTIAIISELTRGQHVWASQGPWLPGPTSSAPKQIAIAILWFQVKTLPAYEIA